ncbi:hypothetical protein P43SY_001282 [Pythium insidiosum]|uniref:Kinesin motor domain-containing protein n=1 Tax=Pythium insidiosum TaxID=114742 RepID=A0AAD5MBG3_PYTIN|nr:hypothetical protein P43SY_001282 [Pythium insidiosum]
MTRPTTIFCFCRCGIIELALHFVVDAAARNQLACHDVAHKILNRSELVRQHDDQGREADAMAAPDRLCAPAPAASSARDTLAGAESSLDVQRATSLFIFAGIACAVAWMLRSMDFANSLRNNRSPNTTPRSSFAHHHRSSAGISINVGASSGSSSAASISPSAAGPARSSPHGSRRASAADLLQRTAITNAYASRAAVELDETASTGSDSAHAVSSPVSVGSARSSLTGSDPPRGSNFKVVIRVRPPLPRELHGDRPFQNVIHVDADGHVLTVSENLSAVSSAGGGGAGGSSGAAAGAAAGAGGGGGAASSGGGGGGGGGADVLDGSGRGGDLEASGGGGGGGDALVSLGAAYGSHVFSFDHVYDQHCTQRVVYENTAKAVVESSLEGYNATIFAYGQTGTGKTYTMEGFNSGSGSVEERGIIPRAIEQIFAHITSNASARMRFLVRASYLQIYNESISDLLKPERSNLTIREDKKRGVFVEGLSEWVVRSPEEIYGLMERGGAMRATGSTKMNEISSRSHAVFIIIAEQSRTSYVDSKGNDLSPEEFTSLVNAYQARSGGAAASGGPNGGVALHPKLESMIRQSFKVGKLNLVDLAGSERVRLSGATGQRLEESKKINQSLSALGNVISALTDARGRQHIPYRDSKLTRILEDSLGGNCKTTMMAMISPALESITESLSTLKFANRAKHIKNEARVNEDLDQKSLLRKYERELKRLRAELEEKSRNVVDKRRLLELDEQRRRAEEDKMAAIRALEERSREFMREKEEKKKLEQRISMLMSQMLMNSQRRQQSGPGLVVAEDGTPSFLSAAGAQPSSMLTLDPHGDGSVAFDAEDPLIREVIKEHQDRIRKEYECRLADLEKERESIEEEKAQVDRYKQLLLKQRDIMIALTQRLNERDEQITALQDELDAYDRHQKELEEKLDEKTAHLIHLQRVTMEQGGPATDWNVARPETAGTAPRPELLLTCKQFRPHAETTVNSAVGASSSLLSATEKIHELQALLEAQGSDQQRLAKELEDVKAEKVSVEFLLRDRLEKLVQVEMEARLKAMAWNQQQHAQEQQQRLQRQLEVLELENRRLRETPPKDQEQLALQARCETLVKERRAVQTIMEQKIKTLVHAIGEASEATFQTAGGAEQLGDAAKWLAKEVHALQRLVNASIVALRNAESNQATHNQLGLTSGSSSSNSSSKSAASSESARDPRALAGEKLAVTSAPSPASTASVASASASAYASPSPPSGVMASALSVDELIQQRRAQLQRERQAL